LVVSPKVVPHRRSRVKYFLK